jgi:hypothetical protein
MNTFETLTAELRPNDQTVSDLMRTGDDFAFPYNGRTDFIVRYTKAEGFFCLYADGTETKTVPGFSPERFIPDFIA